MSIRVLRSVSFLVLLAACVSARPDPLTADPQSVCPAAGENDPSAEPGGWEVIRGFDFETARESGWERRHPEFVRALRHVLDGRFDEADRLFSALVSNPGDSIEALHAAVCRADALMQQSKWLEIAESKGRAAEGPGIADAIALAGAWAGAEPETFSFPESPIDLPARIGLPGTPEIEVSVNGVRKRFLVDTGAGFTVIASDFAEAAGVRPAGDGKAEAGTSTRARVGIRPAVIGEMKLGGLTIRNHPCIIIDSRDLQIKLLGFIRILKIDGIIGWNAISRMDMTLDYGRKRVVIRKPVPSGGAERNFFWLGYPIVKASTASGLPFHFGLDTGANRTHLSEAALSKIDTAGVKMKKTRTGGAGGRIETRMEPEIPSAGFNFDGSAVTFRGIRCGKVDFGTFFILDGILGSDAAKGGVMRLDFTNGRFELDFPGRRQNTD